VTQLDGLKRYLDAATTLTQITRGRAEELVREMVASGEVERVHAQEWVEDLLKRSKEVSETLVAQVTAEVDKQIKNLDLDDLAVRIAGLIDLAGTVGRSVASPSARRDSSERAKPATGSATKQASPTAAASQVKEPKPKAPKSKPKAAKPKAEKSEKKKDSTKSGSPKAAGKGPKKTEAKKSSSGESDFSSGSAN
jgi:polyhydroxyalkanoate synthesis regulator phasin